MNPLLDIEAWKQALLEDLPGAAAQLQMTPEHREHQASSSGATEAAVMALLYPLDGLTGVVFMKRNAYDGPHSGQVSFPGGVREPEDKCLEETALRETREELGVEGKIEIIGAFSKLHIPVSHFMVSPFVGMMMERPDFHPDASEVQYLIESSVEDLLDPACRQSELWELEGRSAEVPFYLVRGEKIWGATAMMLSELLSLAESIRSR